MSRSLALSAITWAGLLDGERWTEQSPVPTSHPRRVGKLACEQQRVSGACYAASSGRKVTAAQPLGHISLRPQVPFEPLGDPVPWTRVGREVMAGFGHTVLVAELSVSPCF